MTTPTDQQDGEQAERIRIAASMGFLEIPHEHYLDRRAFLCNGKTYATPDLPDYFRDANAALLLLDSLRLKGASVLLAGLNEKEWYVLIQHNLKSTSTTHPDKCQAICRAFIAFIDAQKP